MTAISTNHLYAALAFVKLTANCTNSGNGKLTSETLEFAKQIKEFCDLYVPETCKNAGFYIVDDTASAKLDAFIEHHIHELRTAHCAVLPQDKETLLQLYDRLQRRKSRRLQREFYAKATEEKLSDLVLRYFDEEIEDSEAQS